MFMSTNLSTHYRQEASACLKRAESISDSEAKLIWLELVESWQTLAEDTKKHPFH
jgi:hypothetical protein